MNERRVRLLPSARCLHGGRLLNDRSSVMLETCRATLSGSSRSIRLSSYILEYGTSSDPLCRCLSLESHSGLPTRVQTENEPGQTNC